MILLLRFAGGLLLICTGVCGGSAAAYHIDRNRRQIHTFAQFLDYLADLLASQALTAPELLRHAIRTPAFAAFCPAGGKALTSMIPPHCLPDVLRDEIAAFLPVVEESPRQTACATLHQLAARCEAEAAVQAEHCRTARRLWPRLGACLGAAAVILLW